MTGISSPDQLATSTTVAPRHRLVDVLRGLALLGILVVNIEFIVQPAELGWTDYRSPIDLVVRFAVIAFGQTKVYPIFALLFGYGFAMQNRAEKTGGNSFAARHRRRLVGIGLLGIAHGILFFPGDILVIYAVIGAIAYGLRSAGTKTLLAVATVVYLAASVGWLVLGAADALTEAASPVADPDAVRILAEGSFVEATSVRVFYWLVTLAILCVVQGPAVFSFFLVGVVAGRTNLLSEPGQHREVARRVLRVAPVGLAAAIAGAAITLVDHRWETLGFAMGFAAAPLVAAGYIALAAMLFERAGGLTRLLETSGRMSLTIYLAESMVVSTLSYGYGFGLFGHVSPAVGMLIAGAVWMALSTLAVFWMSRFRQGPLEWLLRAFTYGSRPALRRHSGSGRN